MSVPTKITFHQLPSSESVEQAIGERVAKLEQSFARISYCDVVVEAPHRHRRHGNQFHVRIALGVPGKELAVARFGGGDEHLDVYVAIRDAFEALGRQLEHYVTELENRRASA